MKNYEKANAVLGYNRALNCRLNSVPKRSVADIRKTDEFKASRKDAAVDTVIWNTQEKAVRDANANISAEDLEAAILAMGYNKPETEQETIERLQSEFLEVDKLTAYQQFRAELDESAKAVDEIAEDNIPTVYLTTNGTTTTSNRTYYTAREQYEAHRAITRENRERKRGASALERIDANMNAWSAHLEVYSRKFKR